MRKLIALSTLGVLVLLFSQAVFAVYNSNGPLAVSGSTTVAAGSSRVVSGSGFQADSTVTVTIESVPTTLGTFTADGTGAFSGTVTVPASFSGRHTLVATGITPANSVYVLSSVITVASSTQPDTNTLPEGPVSASTNPMLTGIAVIGVLFVSAFTLLFLRRRGSATN